MCRGKIHRGPRAHFTRASGNQHPIPKRLVFMSAIPCEVTLRTDGAACALASEVRNAQFCRDALVYARAAMARFQEGVIEALDGLPTVPRGDRTGRAILEREDHCPPAVAGREDFHEIARSGQADENGLAVGLSLADAPDRCVASAFRIGLGCSHVGGHRHSPEDAKRRASGSKLFPQHRSPVVTFRLPTPGHGAWPVPRTSSRFHRAIGWHWSTIF